jgi:hypothetical protein
LLLLPPLLFDTNKFYNLELWWLFQSTTTCLPQQKYIFTTAVAFKQSGRFCNTLCNFIDNLTLLLLPRGLKCTYQACNF